MTSGPGLRERKKVKTRQAIVDAAFALFAERGFDATTIAEIADAAEVAPRTIHGYFHSKEELLYADFDATLERFEHRVGERAAGESAVDALRGWIVDELDRTDFTDERRLVRKRLRRESESVAAHDARLAARLQSALAEAVADDLGDAPTGLRPRMLAAAAIAALSVIEDDALEAGRLPDDPLADVDHALAFLRGGLAALRDGGA